MAVIIVNSAQTKLPRSFIPFILSAGISNTGMFMQILAEGWLVAELSPEPIWAGIVGFCGGVPLLFLIFGGAIADRFPRRQLLLFSQSTLGIIALLLAVLTYTESIEIWHVAILAFFTGLAGIVHSPSYHSFLYDIVGPGPVSRAVSANGIQLQLSRMLGPVLAGICIEWVGAWGCFLINASSFLVSMAVILFVPVVVSQELGEQGKRLWVSTREGIRYVWSAPRIRLALVLIAVATACVIPQMNLLPLFVKKHLHLGAEPLGWLWGASACGSVVTNMLFLRFGNQRPHLWIAMMFIAGQLAFAASVFLGLSTGPAMAFLSMFAIGGSIALVVVLSQSLVQDEVIPKFRGRAMGIWGTCFQGMFPIGNFLVGSVAQVVGIPNAWIGAATLGSLVFILLWVMGRPARA